MTTWINIKRLTRRAKKKNGSLGKKRKRKPLATNQNRA
jgi:hypothetical protein